MQAGNIIRSNGLTTARYNELSHILGKKRDLRERVQQQAYLYRVNADLRGDKIQPLVDISDATIPRRRGSQVRVFVCLPLRFRRDLVPYRDLCSEAGSVIIQFFPCTVMG